MEVRMGHFWAEEGGTGADWARSVVATSAEY